MQKMCVKGLYRWTGQIYRNILDLKLTPPDPVEFPTVQFCMILQLTMFTGVSKSLPGTCLAVQMRGLLFHSKFVWEFKFISPL